jgi:hypothetical protein
VIGPSIRAFAVASKDDLHSFCAITQPPSPTFHGERD